MPNGEPPVITVTVDDEGIWLHVHLLVGFGRAKYFVKLFNPRSFGGSLETFFYWWKRTPDTIAREFFGYQGWEEAPAKVTRKLPQLTLEDLGL